LAALPHLVLYPHLKHEAMKIEWEDIESNRGHTMSRAKVPGGWLVRICNEVQTIRGTGEINQLDTGFEWRESICFLPDPTHSWGTEPKPETEDQICLDADERKGLIDEICTILDLPAGNAKGRRILDLIESEVSGYVKREKIHLNYANEQERAIANQEARIEQLVLRLMKIREVIDNPGIGQWDKISQIQQIAVKP
jgi:hypothetical protein